MRHGGPSPTALICASATAPSGLAFRSLGQLRQLPADIADARPVSHHRRQLPLRDVETKVDLARRAVQENLTVVQLEAEIAEHRKAESAGKPRGRRPLPPLVKAVGRLPKVVEEIVSVQLTEATVHAVGEDQAPELVQTISQQITELAEMQERLTRSLQGRAPMRGDAAIIKDLGEA